LVHLSNSPLLAVVLDESLDGLVADVLARAVRQQIVTLPNNSLLDGGPPDRRFGRVENQVPVGGGDAGGRVDVLGLGLPAVPAKLLSVRQIETRPRLTSKMYI
jgi:hypothetical protein